MLKYQNVCCITVLLYKVHQALYSLLLTALGALISTKVIPHIY